MLVLFRQMSKSKFQLAFDGPALRAGTMEIGELASSLLAIGDLIRDANQQLNENRAEVSVRVKADFKGGSFDIALLLDQSLLEQAKNVTVQVPQSIFLDFCSEVCHFSLDECESGSPRKGTRGRGEGPPALQPAQP